MVSLSALRTDRLCPPGGCNFCLRLIRPKVHSAVLRIKSMKHSNDPIGNRTRDLTACSSVPQPTGQPRTPTIYVPRPVQPISGHGICIPLNYGAATSLWAFIWSICTSNSDHICDCPATARIYFLRFARRLADLSSRNMSVGNVTVPLLF